jgi:hypothetical protein
MERPQNWIEVVNAPDNALQLDDLRTSAQRGRPFGSGLDNGHGETARAGLDATRARSLETHTKDSRPL